MTDSEVKAALVDRSVLAITLWAEARGDWREGHSSLEERVAVGCVVRNRLPRYTAFRAVEPTWRAVCLAPLQFSCWQRVGGAANYSAVMTLATRIVEGFPVDDPLFAETLYLADGIMAGVILDVTGGATHYYAPKAMRPAGKIPTWAQGKPTRAIGDQLFLNA